MHFGILAIKCILHFIYHLAFFHVLMGERHLTWGEMAALCIRPDGMAVDLNG